MRYTYILRVVYMWPPALVEQRPDLCKSPAWGAAGPLWTRAVAEAGKNTREGMHAFCDLSSEGISLGSAMQKDVESWEPLVPFFTAKRVLEVAISPPNLAGARPFFKLVLFIEVGTARSAREGGPIMARLGRWLGADTALVQEYRHPNPSSKKFDTTMAPPTGWVFDVETMAWDLDSSACERPCDDLEMPPD